MLDGTLSLLAPSQALLSTRPLPLPGTCNLNVELTTNKIKSWWKQTECLNGHHQFCHIYSINVTTVIDKAAQYSTKKQKNINEIFQLQGQGVNTKRIPNYPRYDCEPLVGGQ